MNITKKLRWVVSTTLFTFLALFIISWFVNQQTAVHADELIDISKDRNSVLQLAKSNEAVYYEAVVYQRIDSSIKEPADPYHYPVLPLYSDNLLTQHWVTHEGTSQVTSLETNGDMVFYKMVYKDGVTSIYNFFTDNLITIADLENGEENADRSQNSSRPDSFIEKTVISAWGKRAWVIKSNPIAESPANFPVLSQRLVRNAQGPFAADLDFNQVQWVVEIDQETGLLISESLVALTSPEPTTLYSVTMSEPKVLPTAELPQDWQNLPTQLTRDAQPDISQIDFSESTEKEITKALVSAAFQTYRPSGEALAVFSDSFDRMFLDQNTDNSFESLSHAFEFNDIGIDTEGVRISYMSREPVNKDAPQAIIIVQAPLSSTKAQLEYSFPMWQTSQSIELSVDDQPFTGWALANGAMREEGNNPLIGVVLEINDTLIYVEGQNVTLDELITFVSSFVPAR